MCSGVGPGTGAGRDAVVDGGEGRGLVGNATGVAVGLESETGSVRVALSPAMQAASNRIDVGRTSNTNDFLILLMLAHSLQG